MTLTREQFQAFLSGHRPPPIYVKPPYDIEPCACGDVACKGWRIVPVPRETCTVAWRIR